MASTSLITRTDRKRKRKKNNNMRISDIGLIVNNSPQHFFEVGTIVLVLRKEEWTPGKFYYIITDGEREQMVTSACVDVLDNMYEGV